MKKIIAFILVTLMLTGCQGEGKSKESKESADISSPSEIQGTSENDDELSSDKNEENSFEGLPYKDYCTVGTIPFNIAASGEICPYEDKIFYCLSSKNKNLQVKENGIPREIFNHCVYDVNVVNDRIYFIDTSNENKICSTNLDGSDYKVVIDEKCLVLLVTSKNIIFEKEDYTSYIYDFNGNYDMITDEDVYMYGIYGQWLIITNYGYFNEHESYEDYKLFAYNMETKETVNICDGRTRSVQIYNGFCYFSYIDKYDMIRLKRVNLSGGDIETIGKISGSGFIIINDTLYLQGAEAICKIDLIDLEEKLSNSDEEYEIAPKILYKYPSPIGGVRKFVMMYYTDGKNIIFDESYMKDGENHSVYKYINLEDNSVGEYK